MLNTSFTVSCLAFIAGLTQGLETATTATEVDFAFVTHLAKFGKTYATASEFAERKGIFAATDALIAEHNALAANGEFSYTLGHNQFSTWTTSEYSEMLTAKPTPGTQDEMRKAREQAALEIDLSTNSVNPGTDSTAPGSIKTYATNSLASSIDWRDEGAVTAIQDQGQCGSCWTYMTNGALEGAYKIAGGDLVNLSEQQLLDCAPQAIGNGGCNGGVFATGFTYLMSSNAILESNYPYTSGTSEEVTSCEYGSLTQTDIQVSSWNMVMSQSGDQIKAALSQGPVGILINANNTQFNYYSGGLFSCSSCGTSANYLDHAVLLIGYGTNSAGNEYFILKNSWGTTWGDDGYMQILNDSTGNGQLGMFLSPGIPFSNNSAAMLFSGAIASLSLLLAAF